MDYTVFTVLQGAGLLGLTSGILGCFVLLRQQSLLGDAMSHASFPGIIAMFLITHSKDPWVLLMGGAVAAFCGTLIVMFVGMYSTLKKDAILGVVLSVFFGFGLVLMTIAQKVPVCQQAVLNKFLFGNVALLLPEDIFFIKIMTVIILFILFLFWKECSLYLFDPIQAQLLGYSKKKLELLLICLLVLTIVIGLQTVGVVLMSSLLIAPAAAARQWVSRFHHMVFLSGSIGACSGVIGSFMSAYVGHVPTGPVIVVVVSVFVIISLVFGKNSRRCVV